MNVERLNYQLRRCGKTKAKIASECGISKVTLGAMFRRVMERKSGHTAEQYRITLARVARWCDPDRTPLSALAPLRRFGSAVDWSHWTGVRLKRLGVRDDLTPYFARYTWATLAARLDVPRDTISEALGHSYGSQTTGIYVQFGRDKIDTANRRVLDFVNGG